MFGEDVIEEVKRALDSEAVSLKHVLGGGVELGDIQQGRGGVGVEEVSGLGWRAAVGGDFVGAGDKLVHGG